MAEGVPVGHEGQGPAMEERGPQESPRADCCTPTSPCPELPESVRRALADAAHRPGRVCVQTHPRGLVVDCEGPMRLRAPNGAPLSVKALPSVAPRLNALKRVGEVNGWLAGASQRLQTMYGFLLRNQGVALSLKGQKKSPGSHSEAVCSDHRAQ